MGKKKDKKEKDKLDDVRDEVDAATGEGDTGAGEPLESIAPPSTD